LISTELMGWMWCCCALPYSRLLPIVSIDSKRYKKFNTFWGEHNTPSRHRIEHNTTQHNTTQHNTQHNTTQHHTTPHHTTPHQSKIHHTIQQPPDITPFAYFQALTSATCLTVGESASICAARLCSALSGTTLATAALATLHAAPNALLLPLPPLPLLLPAALAAAASAAPLGVWV
jgi:hypothetical protein